MVKEYLSQKSVVFIERDIAGDSRAMKELVEIGYLTTPVTLVDGEVVVGFDRARLDELLSERSGGRS